MRKGDVMDFAIIMLVIIVAGLLLYALFAWILELIKDKLGNTGCYIALACIGIIALYISEYILPKYSALIGISEIGIKGIQILLMIGLACIPIRIIRGD